MCILDSIYFLSEKYHVAKYIIVLWIKQRTLQKLTFLIARQSNIISISWKLIPVWHHKP